MTLGNVQELDAAREVLRAIEAAGYQALIVGGTVRDQIMGLAVKDVDLATDMRLEELGQLFRLYDIGKNKLFGIGVIRFGAHAFEVAKFRGATRHDDLGRPAGMDASTTFEEDASRRDFTINAMALDSRGNILDPFGGRADIAARLVRSVGSPRERMAEDPLRALRAVRFAARFGFTIEEETARALREIAARLSTVAVERVAEEIIKMASCPGPTFAEAVRLLTELGLLGHVLPEIEALRGLAHDGEHHPEGGVFAHTLAALRANRLSDPIINLAVLLHDVGKAVTLETRNGKPTYHGHDQAGAGMVRNLGGRLKLSSNLTQALAFAAENHMKVLRLGEMRPSKVVGLVADEHWVVLKQVARCDQAARGVIADLQTFDRVLAEAETIAASRRDAEGATLLPVVTGQRVMELTGLAPGPAIGEIIRKTTEWAMDNAVKGPEEIESYVVRLGKQSGSAI